VVEAFRRQHLRTAAPAEAQTCRSEVSVIARGISDKKTRLLSKRKTSSDVGWRAVVDEAISLRTARGQPSLNSGCSRCQLT
jgi:hypothetical protein